jgi:hypothetical protein
MKTTPEFYSLLPPSYLDFITKFGGTKLYRQNNHYQVGVFNSVQIKTFKNGEKYLKIGYFDDSEAYFKYSLLISGQESPVYEWNDEGFEKIADSFIEWLTIRCQDARDTYTEIEWQEIWNGAKPFTSEEEAIVLARKQFQWQVIKFDENLNLEILVQNNSNLTLPYLTIGIKAIDSTDKSQIWESSLHLNVSHIKPQQEGIVEHHIHQKLFTPINTEFFQISDPLPEERNKYWEFQKMKTTVDIK